MASPRTCPHCHVAIPLDQGFTFDEKMNLICGNCGKVAFPTSADSEQINFHKSQQSYVPPRRAHSDNPEGVS